MMNDRCFRIFSVIVLSTGLFQKLIILAILLVEQAIGPQIQQEVDSLEQLQHDEHEEQTDQKQNISQGAASRST